MAVNRVHAPSRQVKRMVRGARVPVPYSRTPHVQVDQSWSPKTKRALESSSSIAASGVLFGTGLLTCSSSPC